MSRRIIIFIGALLILGAVGFFAWNSISQARAARVFYTEDQLARVQRGTLVATVSATGSVQPEQSAGVAFLTSGNLGQIMIKVRDTVKAGQPLAKLDTTDLELQLAQAEANLALAQSKYDQAKKGGSESAIAAAQANLQSATTAYNKLLRPDASSVAAAQANLNSAQAAYDKLLHPDPNELAIAKTDLDKAQAALSQAQAAYDRIGGATNPQIGMTPQSLQLQQATLDYQRAVTTYNAKFSPTDAQLKAAQAQIQQAKDVLAKLTANDSQLAAAQAQIQQAKDALARLSPTSEDLVQAQANVDAVRIARDISKQRIAEATIYAPLDGTVLRADLTKGAFVTMGRELVTIADLAHLKITLNIDETDIPRIVIGQNVALDLDAFPGKTIKGQVVDISPGSATVQGVVNYEVKIQLLMTDVPVKVGMTANASIEVARKEKVLLVPNRAIRASGNKRLVTILDAGKPKDVAVTLGLSNDQETEILNGLNEGDQIVTAITPTNVPGFGGGNNNNGASR